MASPTDQSPPDSGRDGPTRTSYSRRELLGVIVALWLAGSLSDDQTLRLLYGLYGYGEFGFGGGTHTTD